MEAGTPDPSPEAVDAFVSRWEVAKGTERANYQRLLTELCALLDLPQPEPASADFAADGYCLAPVSADPRRGGNGGRPSGGYGPRQHGRPV